MLSSVKYITTSGTSGVGGAAYDEKHVVLPLSSSLPRLSLLPASTSWSGTTSVLFQVNVIITIILIIIIINNNNNNIDNINYNYFCF